MNKGVLKFLKKLVNILRRKKVLQIDLSEKPLLKVEQDRFQADLRIVNKMQVCRKVANAQQYPNL